MIKNSLESLRPQEEKLTGIYRGVVEDNKNDPEKAGRCRIRIFNIHTKNTIKDYFDGIPTEELPWAEPVMGLFEGSVSGFGSWSIPLQGSHVFVFFENGNPMEPRYFATVPGIPEDKNHGFKDKDGFSDPDGLFPKENRLGEPDLHRLARDKSDGTIIQHRKDNKEEDVKLALGEGKWDEPDPYYNKTEVKYPNNKVIATHRGIVIEIEDTEKPRLHVFHPSNTYVEVDDKGNMIVRNANDKYEIVDGVKREYIKDDYHRSVDGNRTNKVKNNEIEEIGNDREREIGNNNTDTVGNDNDITVGNNNNVTIGNEETIEIGSSQTVNIGSSCNVTIGSNCTVTVGGNCNIQVSGTASITASQISLNG